MAAKSKKVGKYLVELQTYPMAGGTIMVWEKGASKLEHIWRNSPDKTMHCIEEVHFMYAQNAIDEYNYIKNLSDLTDLMRRNR